MPEDHNKFPCEPLGTPKNKSPPLVGVKRIAPASYVLSSVGAIRFARGEPRRMTGRRSLTDF